MGAVKRAISSIFSWDFSRIGYTSENTTLLQQFEDAIAYSEEKARTFTPSNASTHFKGDKKLVFAPMVDTSNATDVSYMFYNCSSLAVVPQLDLKKAATINYMFNGCSVLAYLMEINASEANYMTSAFYGCSNLKKIKMLDVKNILTMGYAFHGCSSLEYLSIINLGMSRLDTYDFSGASVWGMDGDENRQSLIDSLITYSYDRASNGMDTATIKLSANTKALLTDEEIAQIEAKGFTIA